MFIRILSLMFIWLIFGPTAFRVSAQTPPDFDKYEYLVTEDGAFGLYKPRGWQVAARAFDNGRMVYVVDPTDTAFASMTLLEPVHQDLDAAGLAAATLQNICRQLPDLEPMEARSNADRTRTLATYRRRSPQNILIQGRYHFNVQHPRAMVTGIEAPDASFKETASTLLTIIANIQMLDQQAYQAQAAKMPAQGQLTPPLREVSAQDRTCRLKVPQGWELAAGKGAALLTTENGDEGYLFSTIPFVGKSRIPHFDSRSIPCDLRYEYMPPIEALITADRYFGSINYKVLERHADPATARQAAASLQRGADAETALVSFTSKNGTAGIGYYDVVGFHPDNAGQWFVMVIGFWAPENRFVKFLPTLIEIAESYRINEAWAADYVERGRQKVREMMQNTSSLMSRYAQEMRESSLAAHQKRMRSSDYISYKFST